MIAAFLLAACSGDAVEPPPAGPLDASWVAALATAPERFTETVGADRAGWAALHRNDLLAAGPGAPGARARSDLGDLHADLARISSLGWGSVVASWEARSGVPEGSALTLYAGLAALEAGDIEQARLWLARTPADSRASIAARLLHAAPALQHIDAEIEEGDAALIERFNAHLAARSSADPGALEALRADAEAPIFEEPAGSGTRAFFDPQIHWTLAAAWGRPALDEPALADLLFTGCPTPDDLRAESARLAGGGARGTLCAQADTWTALGLEIQPGDSDDPERARALVRALDSTLDPWTEALAEAAPPEGRELLEGLRLSEILRSRALLAFARQSLRADHPREALAFAQLAMDLEHPRDLSPINAPGLFAALAEANLRTGHTREALDALQVLVEAYPETAGADEIVGDLAILQNLDRSGDSKEN